MRSVMVASGQTCRLAVNGDSVFRDVRPEVSVIGWAEEVAPGRVELRFDVHVREAGCPHGGPVGKQRRTFAAALRDAGQELTRLEALRGAAADVG